MLGPRPAYAIPHPPTALPPPVGSSPPPSALVLFRITPLTAQQQTLVLQDQITHTLTVQQQHLLSQQTLVNTTNTCQRTNHSSDLLRRITSATVSDDPRVGLDTIFPAVKMLALLHAADAKDPATRVMHSGAKRAAEGGGLCLRHGLRDD